MVGRIYSVLVLAVILAVSAHPRSSPCNVHARIDAGWVCGLQRIAEDGSVYASFRGVPYAKQPIGELRFKELEPLEPWDNLYDARNEGPICHQTDVLYGRLMKPSGMSEACIHANIHVPIEALPKVEWRLVRELLPPREAAIEKEEDAPVRGLPIFVFIHGGGFAFGSGDADVHGPEYMVSKKVIVITFNYRLNVFGFLSLNTSKVPGNAGLRDMVTLLRWVQRNARAFGGDPDNVTLGGQSAGAIAAHLLTLSPATDGLFKRTILMSGTALSGFYIISPIYAQSLQTQLLDILCINATNPDDIYQQLIDLPANKLSEANNILLQSIGLTTFLPVVETIFPEVTTIVDDYPETLIANGRGKRIPLLVGYTDAECETFRRRLEEYDIVEKANMNPLLTIPPNMLFTTPPNLFSGMLKKVNERYYGGNIHLDGYIRSCTDGLFEYPVLKLVETRGKRKNAPIYVYRFSYNSNNTVIKEAIGIKFHGAGHIEDLTYIFKANSVLTSTNTYRPEIENEYMTDLMTNYFINFMTNGKPLQDVNNSRWPPTFQNHFQYQEIVSPNEYHLNTISTRQEQIVNFFDNLATPE